MTVTTTAFCFDTTERRYRWFCGTAEVPYGDIRRAQREITGQRIKADAIREAAK